MSVVQINEDALIDFLNRNEQLAEELEEVAEALQGAVESVRRLTREIEDHRGRFSDAFSEAVWLALPERTSAREEIEMRLGVFLSVMEALYGPDVIERALELAEEE